MASRQQEDVEKHAYHSCKSLTDAAKTLEKKILKIKMRKVALKNKNL